MKKKLLLSLLAPFVFIHFLHAQEKYGKTLNLGVGATFYGYVGRSSPVVMLNYEIDVVKNFTLAPSIGFFTYRNYYGWNGPHKGNPRHPHYYHRYSYRQTVVPIGIKGTYYFDDLLKANKKWDFYAAASLGFAIRTTRWEDDYYRDEYYDYKTRQSSVYLDLHIGTEYHLNSTVGLFAEISTGMLLLGLAVHH